MWKRASAIVLAALLLVSTVGCTGESEPVEIVVSAAASMTDALEEATQAFEAENRGVTIRYNFGSSGALQQQLEKGAPVDLFISAATGPMNALVEKGLVASDAVRQLASNRVVLIRAKAGAQTVTDWADLAKAGRIALGNPAHVPAGQYGKTVLENLSLWGAVEPRLVLAEDVRQVLHFVEQGEVDAGIVYRTDAASSEKVTIIAEAPAGSHKPVVYSMAVVKAAAHGSEAERFATFLLSDPGRQILSRHGFGSDE